MAKLLEISSDSGLESDITDKAAEQGQWRVTVEKADQYLNTLIFSDFDSIDSHQHLPPLSLDIKA